MTLKTKVKISQVTNLSDARYCAGMGVQYLGFNFRINHENYIAPETVKEIKPWISGPLLVGEFEASETSYIKEILSKVPLDMIEINLPDKLNELTLLGKPMILSCDVEQYDSFTRLEEDLNYAGDLVEFFILEQISGKIDDIKRILNRFGSYPILLGSVIGSENIIRILEETNVMGIELKGGKEEQVGFKDYEELADILEKLEIE
jgi:phosphoribosylanthranilate isomerase